MTSEITGVAPRLAAAVALQAVLDRGQALDMALEPALERLEHGQDRALARRLCHAVLRDWPAIQHLLSSLLDKLPQKRERRVLFILAVSLAELREAREPERAVVHTAVEAVRRGGLRRLTGMSNAVLRRYLRERAELEKGLADDPVFALGYPRWLIERLQADWPEQWQAILEAGNQSPPLCLRVNRRHWSREQAASALGDAGHPVAELAGVPDALVLAQRAAVTQLPGFAEGGLSVQDGAAQLVVEYLELADGLRVLDACAAPGGKSAHILERAAVELTALDIDASRLGRVGDSLDRLGLKAKLIAGDAAAPEDWWDGQRFDRILVDAPCSATGVIRRHPDIRWLRKPTDIEALVAIQAAMLNALWPLLSPGGILVYSTCSVLAVENQRQILSFLERHEQLEVIDHAELPGRRLQPGRQILPGEMDMDGFYHCALRRMLD